MNGLSPMQELVVRHVRADDGERLLRLFDRLSPQSVYRRFFTLFPSLPPSVLAHLLVVDHRDHGGLVALDGDEIVAVARWDRASAAGAEPEVSILVEDAWQRRGLGYELMGMLTADVVLHGFIAFTATVLSENGPALKLARRMSRPDQVELDGPVTYFSYRLAS